MTRALLPPTPTQAGATGIGKLPSSRPAPPSPIFTSSKSCPDAAAITNGRIGGSRLISVSNADLQTRSLFLYPRRSCLVPSPFTSPLSLTLLLLLFGGFHFSRSSHSCSCSLASSEAEAFLFVGGGREGGFRCCCMLLFLLLSFLLHFLSAHIA
ncbi:hypothetical protein JOM56_013315, partial [Amanita muscaria]